MNEHLYEQLRQEYPDWVSKDQLYRICHISKKSAKYLLDNSIIPCRITDRKTHKYRIALTDIVQYLKERETQGSRIPHGAVSSRSPSNRTPKRLSTLLLPENQKLATGYFAYLYSDFPDIVDVDMVLDMTGLSRKTVTDLLREGAIESFREDLKYYVAKQHLIDFVTGSRYGRMPSNSPAFRRIVDGFELWRVAQGG